MLAYYSTASPENNVALNSRHLITQHTSISSQPRLYILSFLCNVLEMIVCIFFTFFLTFFLWQVCAFSVYSFWLRHMYLHIVPIFNSLKQSCHVKSPPMIEKLIALISIFTFVLDQSISINYQRPSTYFLTSILMFFIHEISILSYLTH